MQLELIFCHKEKETKQEKCQTAFHFLPRLMQTTVTNGINSGLRPFFNRLKHGLGRDPRKRKFTQHKKSE
jgi:hypothetical protein